MAGDEVAKKIQSKRRSVQKATAEHEKKDAERKGKIQTIRAAYAAEKDGPVLADILAKCEQFRQMHLKLAQDGVGARKTGYKLEGGMDEVENIYLTNNQRAGHLDKAAGIQELTDYINRTINPPQASTPVKPQPQA